MKKSNKKGILFLFLFAVGLILIVLFLPKISKKDLKEKSIYNSAPVENNEEINLGDCPEGCNCTYTPTCSVYWTCGYSSVNCGYQDNNYACAYAYGSYGAKGCTNGCYKRVINYTTSCPTCKEGYI